MSKRSPFPEPWRDRRSPGSGAVAAMPASMARMPVDSHGRPVPWVTGWIDGEPKQGVADGRRCAEAIVDRLCGQCGQPLGYWIAFVGDEVCVNARRFMEPPAHEDCMRYAISVCPFLASSHYEGHRKVDGVVQVADRVRAERMALYITRSYVPYWDSDVPMATAAAARWVEWF